MVTSSSFTPLEDRHILASNGTMQAEEASSKQASNGTKSEIEELHIKDGPSARKPCTCASDSVLAIHSIVDAPGCGEVISDSNSASEADVSIGGGLDHTSISVGSASTTAAVTPNPHRYFQQVLLSASAIGGAGGMGTIQVVLNNKNKEPTKYILLGINISFVGCFVSALIGLIRMFYVRPHSYSQGRTLNMSLAASLMFMVLAMIMTIIFNVESHL